MISETEIINQIRSNFPDHIGDDTAIISGPNEKNYAVTKDMLVENIHFRTRYVIPKSLACKALHVNLSDLAATGAQPQYVLLGIATPGDKASYMTDFISYFCDYCASENVTVIGGDTTASEQHVFISVTALGTINSGCHKTRKGAKSGDVICSTGPIGEAHLGLHLLEKEIADFEPFAKRFLFPQAKIEEGVWLAQQPAVTSMIDTSDGLVVDLNHLCECSSVSADINLDDFVITEGFQSACRVLKLNPTHTLLGGGEDYGLLFTLRKDNYRQLSDQFLKKFGYPIIRIGNIKSGSGITFSKNNQPQQIAVEIFSHFKKN